MNPSVEFKQSKSFSAATESLLDSIQRNPSPVQNRMIDRLPQVSVVDDICHRLIELVFLSGNFNGDAIHDGHGGDNVAAAVENQLSQIADRLNDQISRALFCETDLDSDSIAERSAQHTREFLVRIGELRNMLIADVDLAYLGDPSCKSKIEVVLSFPGIYAVAIYRFAHELYRQKVPLIARVMAESAHRHTGIDIHPGAIIGQKFFVDHGTGVVIGETAQIGDNVKIYQGVTLGAASFKRDENGNIIRGLKRHPTIEDNVVIYAGATILGGRTTIGHDSVIGSNVWLIKSVQPGTTVIMERPKLRMRASGDDVFEGSAHFQI